MDCPELTPEQIADHAAAVHLMQTFLPIAVGAVLLVLLLSIFTVYLAVANARAARTGGPARPDQLRS
jgi:hypothetical protein